MVISLPPVRRKLPCGVARRQRAIHQEPTEDSFRRRRVFGPIERGDTLAVALHESGA
jgi:hypothetical protein